MQGRDGEFNGYEGAEDMTEDSVNDGTLQRRKRAQYRNLPPIEVLRKTIAYSPESGIVQRLNKECIAKTPQGYLTVWVCGGTWLVHRIAWFLKTGVDPKEMQIDHANGVRDDNRWLNLRIADGRKNRANSIRRQSSAVPFKGVQKRGRRYRARIRYGGKDYFLGAFATPEEAHERYCKEAKRIFGEFACAGIRNAQ